MNTLTFINTYDGWNVNLLYSMNDQADVKDNEHMVIVPKYFEVRSPTENKRR